MNTQQPIRDHFGHEFKNLGAMARAYGIEHERLRKRLAAGWDVRRALTTPIKESPYTKPVVAPNGVKYPNYRAMCDAYGVPYERFKSRISFRGWGMEQALTNYKYSGASIPARDHTGRDFHSLSEMARAWGVTPNCLLGRLNAGWSIERALTTPQKDIKKKYEKLKPEYDHDLD